MPYSRCDRYSPLGSSGRPGSGDVQSVPLAAPATRNGNGPPRCAQDRDDTHRWPVARPAVTPRPGRTGRTTEPRNHDDDAGNQPGEARHAGADGAGRWDPDSRSAKHRAREPEPETRRPRAQRRHPRGTAAGASRKEHPKPRMPELPWGITETRGRKTEPGQWNDEHTQERKGCTARGRDMEDGPYGPPVREAEEQPWASSGAKASMFFGTGCTRGCHLPRSPRIPQEAPP
jgi:hypothetical protein